MLPAAFRLTDGRDFRLVVRRGRRAGRGCLIVYLLAGTEVPTRVGFVVSKGVGNSVVRHRTVRRLRHLARQRLDRWPTGNAVVIRALPQAATASSAELGMDLDAAMRRLLNGVHSVGE